MFINSACLLLLLCALQPLSAASAQPPTPSGGVSEANSSLQEAVRLYNEFHYVEAVAALDRLIASLTPGEGPQRDILVRAYEYRARSRFVLKDAAGVEADFAALLQLRPDYQPDPGMSPRVRPIFGGVKARTVGDMALQLTPPGEVYVDGHPYAATSDPITLSLVAGEHVIAAKRDGYGSIERRVVVNAGDTVPLALVLERTTATLTLRTIPDGVDVFLDGVPKGTTSKSQNAAGVSGPLRLTALSVREYVTRFRRDCFKPLERAVKITQLDDVEFVEPVRLEPAIATVTLRVAEPDVTIYVDGVPRAPVPGNSSTVCEGEHVIEVRSPKGRFIDRRSWRADDAVTLDAVLRPAFAIVVNTPPTGIGAREFTSFVERGLAGGGALLFAPQEQELSGVERADAFTADFFHGTSAAASLRRREVSDRVAGRLGAQGLAAIESTGNPDLVKLSVLATGSAEPEVLTLNLSDPISRTGVMRALAGETPPIVRVSLGALLVDVAGIPGAVVVRAGTGLDLAPADVITRVGDTEIASVADVWASLNGRQGQEVSLVVRSVTGATRTIPATASLVPDTLPLADTRLLYNGMFLRLRDRVRDAKTAVDATAARLNLAIVEMRLGRWREASENLQALRLPDGEGVSGGTVAYLLGLCYEALGRQPEATSSFTAAARSTNAMLSVQGPRIAPLAQVRLETAPR